jgi:hypothetical protein
MQLHLICFLGQTKDLRKTHGVLVMTPVNEAQARLKEPRVTPATGVSACYKKQEIT